MVKDALKAVATNIYAKNFTEISKRVILIIIIAAPSVRKLERGNTTDKSKNGLLEQKESTAFLIDSEQNDRKKFYTKML